MKSALCLMMIGSSLLWFGGFVDANPATYDGYVKCADGSSPQKDESGKTLACQPGQSYNPCPATYECTSPLPGRPGVCCKMGYVSGGGGGGGGANTDAPPPVTAPPLPPPETMAPPPVSETLAPPPPPPETMVPPSGGDTVAPTLETAPTMETESTAAPVDQSSTTVQGGGEGSGGGVEITPPPPAPIDPSATTTTEAPVAGGIETTTSLGSIDVVTDSNGGAMVSPNSVAQNKKSNHTGADVQKGQKPVQPSKTGASKTPGHDSTTPHKPQVPAAAGTKPTVAPNARKATATTTPQPAPIARNGTRPSKGRFSDHV